MILPDYIDFMVMLIDGKVSNNVVRHISILSFIRIGKRAWGVIHCQTFVFTSFYWL